MSFNQLFIRGYNNLLIDWKSMVIQIYTGNNIFNILMIQISSESMVLWMTQQFVLDDWEQDQEVSVKVLHDDG